MYIDPGALANGVAAVTAGRGGFQPSVPGRTETAPFYGAHRLQEDPQASGGRRIACAST